MGPPTAISTSLGREKRLQEVVEETGGTKKAVQMSVAPIDIPFVDNDRGLLLTLLVKFRSCFLPLWKRERVPVRKLGKNIGVETIGSKAKNGTKINGGRRTGQAKGEKK